MTGYSRPAERLGARLARRLNTPHEDGADSVRVEPWLLYQDLLRALTERYYQITLVGLDELGLAKPRDEYRTGYNDDQFAEAERGAEMWLDRVLDAPRHVHPRKETHEAHNLLHSLASRGVDWPEVTLARADAPAPPALLPRWLRRTAEALQTAAARTTTARVAMRGGRPLHLRAGAVALDVPEGLSIWQAIGAAPEHCAVITGRAADEQVYLFARAVHGANKHWDALRRLSLSPVDWMNREDWEPDGKLATLSTSQAMDALKLVAAAQEAAMAAGREAPQVEDFRGAWDRQPILKRMDFATFAASPAGRALLTAASGVRLDLPEEAAFGPDTEASPVDLAEHSDLMSAIDRLEDSGMFQAAEIRLLRAIAGGESLTVIHAEDAELRRRYRQLEDLKAALDPLQDRVLEAIARGATARPERSA